MTMQPNSNTCNCRFSFNLQPTNYSPKGNHLITDLYFFVCVSVCVCVCVTSESSGSAHYCLITVKASGVIYKDFRQEFKQLTLYQQPTNVIGEESPKIFVAIKINFFALSFSCM